MVLRDVARRSPRRPSPRSFATSGRSGRLDLPFLTVAVQLGFAVGGDRAGGDRGAGRHPRTAALRCGRARRGRRPTSGSRSSRPTRRRRVPFRFLTGVALAAVYPVAMKLAAGWFRRDRGLAIGVVIGALTVGVALPFLFRAIGAYAGVRLATGRRRGERRRRRRGGARRVRLRGAGRSMSPPRGSRRRSRPPRSASRRSASPTIGYLGHMWELFAMWTWIPIFLIASFAAAGVNDPALASPDGVRRRRRGWRSAAWSPGRSPIASAGRRRRSRRWRRPGPRRSIAGILFGAPVADRRPASRSSGACRSSPTRRSSRPRSPSWLRPGRPGRRCRVQPAVGFTLTSVTILGVGLLDPTDADGWRLACDHPRPRPGRRDRRDVAAARSARRHEDGQRPPMTDLGRRARARRAGHRRGVARHRDGSAHRRPPGGPRSGRRRVGGADRRRSSAILAEALTAVVEGLSDADLRRDGGEEDWNVAQAIGHACDARAGPVPRRREGRRGPVAAGRAGRSCPASPARRRRPRRRSCAGSPRASGSSSGRPGPWPGTRRSHARWTTRSSAGCAAGSGWSSPASTT